MPAASDLDECATTLASVDRMLSELNFLRHHKSVFGCQSGRGKGGGSLTPYGMGPISCKTQYRPLRLLELELELLTPSYGTQA